MLQARALSERRSDVRLAKESFAWAAFIVVLLFTLSALTLLAQPFWASEPLLLLMVPIVFGTALLLAVAAHDDWIGDH